MLSGPTYDVHELDGLLARVVGLYQLLSHEVQVNDGVEGEVLVMRPAQDRCGDLREQTVCDEETLLAVLICCGGQDKTRSRTQ